MAQVVVQERESVQAPRTHTLNRLLAEHGTARAESGLSQADHLTMTLIALDRLGATPQVLNSYADAYRSFDDSLPPAVSPGRVLRPGWRNALGDPAMEQAYRGFFESELVRLGRDAMLREYLPDLMEGCGAAGFHPMIRLSLALQCDADSEIVVALAYWAAAFLRLNHKPRERVGEADPRGVLDRLRREAGLGSVSAGATLPAGMNAVSEKPRFRAVLHWLSVDDATLAKMANTSLALFAGTCSEATLHLLAATHALRVLLPWLYDPTPALRYHWQAVAAAYFAMGCPPLAALPPDLEARGDALPSWPALCNAAIASCDDHVIQAVYVCAEEHAAYGGEAYRAAAAGFVERQC